MIESRTNPPPAPELLAPAGDFEAMRAAVANGADAVYFGLQEFNARHRAHNFTLDDLPRVMDYLHARSVRGFLTFNILIFSDELPAALDHLRAAHAAGVDAVIVQDLGLVELIRRAVPGLEIHGSTQMTLTEPRGIEFVRRLGVERIVLARELSLDDIRTIRAATDTPVEVFVHGALCVSYSGQCLTSESLGGRSANRGQCAQACRLPYDLVVDDRTRDLGDVAYLLSPQDLEAAELVRELVELGVCSFKIEGRLKHAHYVAATAATYRAAIDAALARRPFQLTTQQRLDLEQSFSRGLGPGFLTGVDHQRLVPGDSSKKRGLRLGTVLAHCAQHLTLTLEHPAAAEGLQPGDGIAFQLGTDQNHELGGRISRLRLRDQDHTADLTIHNLDPRRVAIGSVVWKTDDPQLRKRLEQTYSRDLITRRTPLRFTVRAVVGEPLQLTAADPAGRRGTVTSDAPLEPARKHAANLEMVRDQLARLGDTPFELGDVELDTGDTTTPGAPGAMIPKSLLNDLRRRVIEKLLTEQPRRVETPGDPNALQNIRTELAACFGSQSTNQKSTSLLALVRTLDQLETVLAWRDPTTGDAPTWVYADFEDVRRYKQAVDLARAAGVKIALATTRIIKPAEHGLVNHVASCNPDAFLVRNLAAVELLRDRGPLIGDYTLNVANEITAGVYLQAGLARLTASYDLNWRQLHAMLARIDPAVFEATVHQHMPMFHTEHCVFAHTLSDGSDYRTCGRPCEQHTVSLRDRAGVDHPLVPDVGCRNTIYNGTAQSAAEFIPKMLAAGLRHFRVELLRDTPQQTTALLDRYARILAGEEQPQSAWRSLQVVNQLGVTRGTLESE